MTVTRQGCVLSPILFNLYGEWIFKDCKDRILNIGIKVGGTKVNNIRYADNTIVIMEIENDLQKTLSIVNEVSNTYGLKINTKTKNMVMSKSNKENHFKPANFFNKWK